LGADFRTYFVGCDEWGFSVWAHNAECTVREVRAAAEALGEGYVKQKPAARLAYAIRTGNAGHIQQAMADAGLRSASGDLLGHIESIKELGKIGLVGKELTDSVRAVGGDLKVLQGLRETGMSGPEIAHYLRTLGDVQVFRGTTVGFAGHSPGLLRTPVSVDPARATAFAVTADTQFGYGVVLYGSRTELGGKGALIHGNRNTPTFMVAERELNAVMSPVDLANRASGQIRVHAARDVLSSMGIDVPPTIRGYSHLQAELGHLPVMTSEQIQTFIRLARGK
jgi:hypothetical protein